MVRLWVLQKKNHLLQILAFPTSEVLMQNPGDEKMEKSVQAEDGNGRNNGETKNGKARKNDEPVLKYFVLLFFAIFKYGRKIIPLNACVFLPSLAN